MRIFGKQRDFEALEEVIGEAKRRVPMRLLGWCVMPSHWHFVLWPRGDGDLSEFMRWLTVTHTQRWHAAEKAHCRSLVGPRDPRLHSGAPSNPSCRNTGL